jgi:hypothetical protein
MCNCDGTIDQGREKGQPTKPGGEGGQGPEWEEGMEMLVAANGGRRYKTDPLNITG